MQRSDTALQSGEEYRQLRAITILTLPFGIGLTLPFSVITGRSLPALGILPMVFSAVLGGLMYANLLRAPSAKAHIDVALTLVYLSLLLPR
jgi:hypothetical protein